MCQSGDHKCKGDMNKCMNRSEAAEMPWDVRMHYPEGSEALIRISYGGPCGVRVCFLLLLTLPSYCAGGRTGF